MVQISLRSIVKGITGPFIFVFALVVIFMKNIKLDPEILKFIGVGFLVSTILFIGIYVMERLEMNKAMKKD